MTAKTEPPPPDSVCWAKAKTVFLENLLASKKRPSQESIDRFLKEDFRLDKAISKCQTLKNAADNQYNKGKGSRFVGKLLQVLVTVKEIADPFLEFAPESVSIAWSAVSFLIQVGASDLENCGLIAEACTSIATVILNCRLYENRYTQTGRNDAGDEDTEKEIMNAIPNLLSLVLEFSWYIQNRLSENKILRSFKETFNPKLKDKYEELQEDYKKLRTIAGDAFQERVMDMMDHLSKHGEDMRTRLFPALEDIKTKLEDISDIKQIVSEGQVREQFTRNRNSLSPTDIHEQQLNIILNPLSHETEHLCQWLFNDEYYLKWEQNPTSQRPSDDTKHNEIIAKISDTDRKVEKTEKTESTQKQESGEEAEKLPRVCYIKGRPGFGKSVTVACALARLSKPERKSSVCYFFFKKGDDTTQTTRQAISSFACQLFSDKIATTRSEMEKFNAVIEKIRHTVVEEQGTQEEDAEGGAGGGLLSNTVLKKLIDALGKTHGKPIYLVLDAIDECTDYETEELVPWLLELARSPESNFKVLFSSRDNLGLESLLTDEESSGDNDADAVSEGGDAGSTASTDNSKSTDGSTSEKEEGEEDDQEGGDDDEDDDGASTVKQFEDSIMLTVTQKTNSADMDAYLTGSLTKLVTRRMVNYRFGSGKKIDVSRMVAGIKKKANGMFTYSAMVIASLGQPSSLSLTERLKRLPDGMDELYRRRLEALTAEERKLVTLALKRIVFSLGDIGTVEIAEEFKRMYDREKEDDEDDGDEDGFDIVSHVAESQAGDNDGDNDEDTPGEDVENVHLQVAAEDEPAISVVSEVESDTDLPPWHRALENAMNNTEVADTIYHLEQAGRDFFQFSGEKKTIDVIHKSVRDWVENESRRVAERDSNKVSLNSLFTWDDKTQTLRLSMPIPSSLVQSPNNIVDFLSERESHLDIALYTMRVLNNPKFQDLYMPEPSGADDGDEDGEDGEEANGEDEERPHGDDEDADATEIADAAPENQVETPSINVEEPVPETEEVEAIDDEEEGQGSDGSDGSDGSEGSEDEDDFQMPVGVMKAHMIADEGLQTHQRYELVRWGQHLKRVQELFPPNERVGPKWEALWEEITKFLEPSTFKRWAPHFFISAFNTSVEQANQQELGALQLVSFWGLTMVMEYLLDVMHRDPNEMDSDGETALITAFSNPNMTELLLKRNADVTVRGFQGKTAFQMAMSAAELSESNIDLESQTVQDLINAAKLLIEAGSDVNDADKMPKKKPPIHSAIAIGDLQLFNLFMEHNADVNAADLNAMTPLHRVFINSSTADKETRATIAESLINAGANVNAEDIDSMMPLYHAVSAQNKRGVAILLENGADIHDATLLGYQAIHEATSPRDYEDEETAIDIINQLLEKGADLTSTSKIGATPLTLALEYKHLAVFEHVIQKLLEQDPENKSHLTKVSFNGENLYHQMSHSDEAEIAVEACDVLGKYLTPEEIKVMMETKEPENSRTPLLQAAAYEVVDLVQYILGTDANIDTEDSNGKNVLELLFETWLVHTAHFDVPEQCATTEEIMISLITRDQKLLKESGIDFLRGASSRKSEQFIRALVDIGIDPLIEDESGWNCMDLVIANRLVVFDSENIETAITEYRNSTFNDKVFKSPTRMSGTKKSKYIEVSEDGLSVTEPVLPDEMHDEAPVAAVVYADAPVSPKVDVFYFETTMTFKDPENTYVTIGLVADPCPVDRVPGLRVSNTVGYAWHGNDEFLYYSKDVDTYKLPDYEEGAWITGDIIGCGWNVADQMIFYTKNGKLLGSAWEAVPGDKLWPAIGGKAPFEAKVNFGTEAFKWTGIDEMKAEIARKRESPGEN
ncbi:hypothetical protein H072_7756 [Dactylellina haptotyla CBS 200.50]|uniref:B30.2/SPRY domain-containing protein n=1 Tax=Dactylellina haptotyla (strain CBS 200.50) TaxID=1284197 RepID=S8BGT4_DACHA|nr:hypothetical protein H072_7756 [Dactylellina haptotyla CBS 200.50]